MPGSEVIVVLDDTRARPPDRRGRIKDVDEPDVRVFQAFVGFVRGEQPAQLRLVLDGRRKHTIERCVRIKGGEAGEECVGFGGLRHECRVLNHKHGMSADLCTDRNLSSSASMQQRAVGIHVQQYVRHGHIDSRLTALTLVPETWWPFIWVRLRDGLRSNEVDLMQQSLVIATAGASLQTEILTYMCFQNPGTSRTVHACHSLRVFALLNGRRGQRVVAHAPDLAYSRGLSLLHIFSWSNSRMWEVKYLKGDQDPAKMFWLSVDRVTLCALVHTARSPGSE
jgi:hypothetical protein